jgi:hypothetical protein
MQPVIRMIWVFMVPDIDRAETRKQEAKEKGRLGAAQIALEATVSTLAWICDSPNLNTGM